MGLKTRCRVQDDLAQPGVEFSKKVLEGRFAALERPSRVPWPAQIPCLPTGGMLKVAA